jgi:hypothetical protein
MAPEGRPLTSIFTPRLRRFTPRLRRGLRRLLWAAAAIAALGAGLIACVSKPEAVWLGGPGADAAALNLRLRPVATDFAPSGALRLLGAVELVADTRAFGGFSGLEISADGTRILAVSDAGAWVSARLVRDGPAMRAIEALGWGPLHDPHGGVDRRGEYRDAEGLAALPDGAILVSYEGMDRLARFAAPDAPEDTLRLFGEADGFGRNSGLEALALRPDGDLLAVRENGASEDLTQQALILGPDGAVIREILLQKQAGLRIVGADIDADGRLWTVQRGFTWLGGFFFALETMAPDGDGYGAPTRLGVLAGKGADNAEGLAVWRDDQGRVRLAAITDDNFMGFQRTILYDFVVERPDGETARAQ